MKSHWIEHQGKRIFFADYSGFGEGGPSLRAELKSAVETIAKEPEKSVLVLANFEGTEASMSNLKVLRQFAPKSKHAVRKRAILGVSGTRRFFITTLGHVIGNAPMEAFDSQEQALDWLVS